MVKVFRVIVASAVLLILGWTIPAHSRQEQQDKPKDQEKQQQQAKPAEKQQQPAKPTRQDQAQADKQHGQQQQQRQQQDNSAKPQQQAKGQRPQQDSSAKQQPQQAKGQQLQQQGASAEPRREAKGQRPQQVASSQRPQHTQQEEVIQRAQPALRLSVRGSDRIPDERFHSNFGREHEFRIGNPVLVAGYSRFQYGGFWFGFLEPWPVDWYYTDDVYIDYVDGGYYMYDPYYPGARFAISVVL
jgi:hypothetical protein